METIKIIVVSDNADERNSALDILANVDYIEVVGDGKTGLEALGFLEEFPVDLVLLGAATDGDGYALARELLRRKPGAAVIMIERELTEETVRHAVTAGARDVVLAPLEPSRLVQAIYLGAQDQQAAGDGFDTEASGTGKVRARGRIMTFFCTKGGVGKTFSSVNTAVALARVTGKKVALVDLDLDFGNAALAFNTFSRRSLLELAEELSLLDIDLVESYLVAHSSGVKVLPAGTMPQATERISGEQVETILRTLAAAYDYVVVDMPPRITGPLDPAIREVDLLFLVTTPEVSTIRNVKLIIKMLSAAGYPRSKIRVLLNRDDPRSGIRARDVEATLKEKLFAIIPADYKRVPASMNRGEPLVLLYPRSKVARAFKALAARIVARAPGALAPAAEGGLFKKVVLGVLLFPFRLIYKIVAFIFLLLLKAAGAFGRLVAAAFRVTKATAVKVFGSDETMQRYLRRVSDDVEVETSVNISEESRGDQA
jgi:pilus assembly protein CpaE